MASFDCTNHHLCVFRVQWRCSNRNGGRFACGFLESSCHFEFVLRRGDKRVCIVEAKKDDMRQGMVQDLLGCEVAAEINHLNLVFSNDAIGNDSLPTFCSGIFCVVLKKRLNWMSSL
jgi:hypothetical protein